MSKTPTLDIDTRWISPWHVDVYWASILVGKFVRSDNKQPFTLTGKAVDVRPMQAALSIALDNINAHLDKTPKRAFCCEKQMRVSLFLDGFYNLLCLKCKRWFYSHVTSQYEQRILESIEYNQIDSRWRT